jgi:hypothetical protein
VGQSLFQLYGDCEARNPPSRMSIRFGGAFSMSQPSFTWNNGCAQPGADPLGMGFTSVIISVRESQFVEMSCE